MFPIPITSIISAASDFQTYYGVKLHVRWLVLGELLEADGPRLTLNMPETHYSYATNAVGWMKL